MRGTEGDKQHLWMERTGYILALDPSLDNQTDCNRGRKFLKRGGAGDKVIDA